VFDNNIYGFRCFRSRNNGKNEDKSSPCCRPCADDDNVDELYVDTVNKPTNGEQPAPRNKVQNAYHNQLSRQLKQVNNGQCNADDDGLEPSSGTRPASPAESLMTAMSLLQALNALTVTPLTTHMSSLTKGKFIRMLTV
jgi:hypothetical protein